MSTWMSRVGGIRNVTPGSQLLLSVSGNRVPTASMTSASPASRFAGGEPQKPIMPSSWGWPGGRTPVPIRLWTTGRPGELGEARDRRRGPPRPSAGQQDGSPGPRAARRRSPRRSRGSGPAAPRATRARPRHRGPRRGCPSGPTRARDPACPRAPVSHARARIARHLVRATDAPGALHERLVDRYLVGVAAEVELLVRAASLVVGRHVARRSRPAGSSRRPPSRRRSPRWSCPARRGGAGRPAGRLLGRARLPHARRPARGAPS